MALVDRGFRVERHFVVHGVEATERLGRWFGERVGAGTVIALSGELGAGKTSFVRGLAQGLGIEGPVTSPTYALLQTYTGRLELAHMDAWMEGRERSFLADGGWEWLGADGVAAVEWAERVADWLPPTRLVLDFAHRNESERTLRVAVLGEGALAERLEELATGLPVLEGMQESPR